MVKITKESALEYHQSGRPGKIEVKPTKPYHTQTDLSLAYSPGVAFPCLEIQSNPNDVYKYTDFCLRYTEALMCSTLRLTRKIPRSSARL